MQNSKGYAESPEFSPALGLIIFGRETDQKNWSVRVEYILIFHPYIPPVILGMVYGYVAMDTVVPSVENILCNKLNIQPFLVKYSGILLHLQ